MTGEETTVSDALAKARATAATLVVEGNDG